MSEPRNRVETLHAGHGTELEPVRVVGVKAAELSPVVELSLWIDQERPKWHVRGVDVVERGGITLFPGIGVSGKLEERFNFFVGSIESCARSLLLEADFVHLKLLGDGMSVGHAQLLIENAVDQVAGR